MRFKQIDPYRLPTEYEMRDVFETINEMGGQVIRIYTVPVKSAHFRPARRPMSWRRARSTRIPSSAST